MHHEYFHRLRNEEETRLCVMFGHTRALSREMSHQREEEAEERIHHQEEIDRREAERRREADEEDLRRSREQIR